MPWSCWSSVDEIEDVGVALAAARGWLASGTLLRLLVCGKPTSCSRWSLSDLLLRVLRCDMSENIYKRRKQKCGGVCYLYICTIYNWSAVKLLLQSVVGVCRYVSVVARVVVVGCG